MMTRAQTDHLPPVTKTRFSTERLPRRESFDAWRENMRPLAKIDPRENGSSFGVHTMETWTLGDSILCLEDSPGARFVRTGRDVRGAVADHYYLYLMRKGSYTVATENPRAANAIFHGTPGRLALHSLTTPCTGEMRDLDSAVLLFMPRDKFGRLACSVDALVNTNLNGPLGSLLYEYLLLLRESIATIGSEAAHSIGLSIVDILSAMVASPRERATRFSDVMNVALKTRIRDLILREISNRDLSVDDIAQNIGISRSALYRLFNEEGGVANYIEKLRTRAVLNVFCNAGNTRSLEQIATDHGFRSSSDLSRSFRRRFDLSPRDMRELLRGKTPETLPSHGLLLNHFISSVTHSYVANDA